VSTETEETRKVTLAGTEVEVLPQPPIYVSRRLKEVQDSLSEFVGDEDIPVTDLLFGRLGHQVFRALIGPEKFTIPLHAWMGYPTEQAMADGDLDETQPPHPPTFPEIKAAFTAVKEVNDYDLFERLFGMLDPHDRQELLGMVTGELLTVALSSLTPSSPSAEGGSEVSTSSTATSPTPTPNGSGSLSPASMP
jgi:hypothetical protein